MSGTSGLRHGQAMREIHVIEDGALLIKDGVIEHVGTSRRVEKLAEARKADVLDATGRVVTPGFVDCFTQLMCGPPRRHAESGEAFAAAARIFRSWSPQRLELEGRKRLRQFIRFGSTTVAGSSGYGLCAEAELRSLRAMDRLRNGPIELTPHLYTTAAAWQAAGSSAWEFLETMGTLTLPTAHAKRLLTGVVIGSGFPGDAIDGYLACAQRLGLTAFIETGGAAVELACRTGAAAVLDLSGIAVDQMAALAGAGTAAVLLPGRSFQCGNHGFAPARRLIDEGSAVALATGFDTLDSPTASIPMVMALACTQMRMTAEEALTAVTVNAAHALGIGARAGALQYGMQADLLMMDCGDYREIPLYFGMNPVAIVVRRGEIIFPRVEASPAQ